MNNYHTFHTEIPPYQSQVPEPWRMYQNNTGYITPQNRFVYLKQNFIQTPQDVLGTTVHINPNFNKKVFVNPNFQRNISEKSVLPKIHINPNINITKQMSRNDIVTRTNKIHVNPNILQNIPVPEDNINASKDNVISNKIVYSSRTKLIRKPESEMNQSNNIKSRRLSVCSKYKIVKSSLQKRKESNDVKTRLRKSSFLRYKSVNVKKSKTVKKRSLYKLDNRCSKEILTSPKVCLVKYKTPSASLLKIGNVLYRKSLHSLRRTSDRKASFNSSRIHNKVISKSRYKLRRKSISKSSPTKSTVLNRSNSKTKLRLLRITKLSRGKLKKCNIPCPYYRKFGKCVKFEKGRCPRKHDSDQIALCTKFLQGACINEKCLLSHNVSPEKMPTCKYYLEGTCSKDQCPYLHVRISPKADVCKDFLEGFCKKATECDKRHQFLCPDFEKYGKCLKQRCPYPHGRMVRKYSVLSNNKFAKKSSDTQIPCLKDEIDNKILIGEEDDTKSDNENQINPKNRYYTGRKVTPESGESSATNTTVVDNVIDTDLLNVRSRPNLGILPSYIALEDS